jgi:hypothetical protein
MTPLTQSGDAMPERQQAEHGQPQLPERRMLQRSTTETRWESLEQALEVLTLEDQRPERQRLELQRPDGLSIEQWRENRRVAQQIHERRRRDRFRDQLERSHQPTQPLPPRGKVFLMTFSTDAMETPGPFDLYRYVQAERFVPRRAEHLPPIDARPFRPPPGSICDRYSGTHRIVQTCILQA